MHRKLLSLLCLGLLSLSYLPLSAAVQTREVSYEHDGLTLKGYYAWDDAVKTPHPAILVVHEWWGHNDYARERARMLAALGYPTLAVDMYGEGKTAAHPKEAGAFAGAVKKDFAVAQGRFQAAAEWLKQQSEVDPERLGAVGYCFGGGLLLELALRGEDLTGIVSFHGSLPQEKPVKAKVKAAILVCHGAIDPFIPPEKVAGFAKLMAEHGIDYQFEAYAGASHSFTSKAADTMAAKFDLPIAYQAEADARSWQAMQRFFADLFEE